MSAAIHEAGHAIVARHHGFEVYHLSVDGEEGLCRYRGRGTHIDDLCISIAGLIAECIELGLDPLALWERILAEVEDLVDDDDLWDEIEGSDEHEVWGILLRLRFLDLAAAVSYVEEVLRDQWHAVEAQAAELLEAA